MCDSGKKLCTRKSEEAALVSSAITCGIQDHLISLSQSIISPQPEVALWGKKKKYVNLFFLSSSLFIGVGDQYIYVEFYSMKPVYCTSIKLNNKDKNSPQNTAPQNLLSSLNLYIYILKFIYLLNFLNLFILDRGKGKKTERERNINVWLPLTHPLLGIGPGL